MSDGRFSRYELRTKDVLGARTFYDRLFGDDFGSEHVTIVALPEQAAARGAPSHWLGCVGAPNVEDVAGRIVQLGGQRLGPTREGSGGSKQAALRDPFGAVMGITSAVAPTHPSRVAWHILHTTDEQAAFAMYADLFGWTAGESMDMGPQLGSHQMFAWKDSRENVGSVANTALRPHVHRHWQFYFAVDDMAASLANARELGAHVLEPVTTPAGVTFAACDDPQGAAFGLVRLKPDTTTVWSG